MSPRKPMRRKEHFMQDYNSEKFKSINPKKDSKNVFEFGKMT